MNISSATITKRGQIVIPKATREHGPFKEGERIAVLSFPDRIEIRSLKEFEERLYPMLASEESLARDWNKPEEDKAWKDL